MRFTQSNLSRALPAVVALALLGLAGRTAHAQTVTGDTGTVIITAPANVGQGQVTLPGMENSSDVIAFQEQQNVLFTGNVDISAPGTYGPKGGTNYPSPLGVMLTNQLVDSFYFYSDPPGKTMIDYMGSITFSAPILGLEVFTSSLDGTDLTLGLQGMGTTYQKGGARGLEKGADTISLSGNTVSWNVFDTSSDVDSVRVLVAVVPEPTAALPMGMGLMLLTGLVLWRRRPARGGQSA